MTPHNPQRAGSGLPHRGSPKRVIIAQHVILTGYGHWLPNDPRGSGSIDIHKRELEKLGEIHHGRKRVQPSRDDLQDFYQRAVPHLKYEPLWFDSAMRQALSEAFAQVIQQRRYVVYACAILSNHAHFVIRSHRDRTNDMFGALTHESALAIN